MPVDRGTPRFFFPLAHEKRLGYAEVFIAKPGATTEVLPKAEFLLHNLLDAWGKLPGGGGWPVKEPDDVCWKLQAKEPGVYDGSSANLATLLAVAHYSRPFRKRRLNADSVWATGEILSSGELKRINAFPLKVVEFLEACRGPEESGTETEQRRSILFAPISNRIVADDLPKEHREAFSHAQFDRRWTTLPSSDKPTIIYLHQSQVGELIHWLWRPLPWWWILLLVLLVVVVVGLLLNHRGGLDPSEPSASTSVSRGDRSPNEPRTTPLPFKANLGKCSNCEPPNLCIGNVCREFILVPAGSFKMGTEPDEVCRATEYEGPVHDVTLSHGFFMGATEVTQGEWTTVIGANPSAFKQCGDRCPVEMVSWFMATEYCNRLSDAAGLERCYEPGRPTLWNKGYDCKGFRLPTEAEWEYAARAGTHTALPAGDMVECHCGDEPSLRERGWYCGNSTTTFDDCVDLSSKGGPRCAGPHPVGTKMPNSFGLYDMAGNVWEWCWDWWGQDYYSKSPATNPLGPDYGAFRTDRGGAWNREARKARSGHRSQWDPNSKTSNLGFRVVRTL